MSRKFKLNLYENAVPLSEAWRKFAIPEHRAAFEKAERFVDAFANGDTPKDWMTILNSVDAGISAEQRRNALISEMQDQLLDSLYNSEFIALGIRQRPSKGYYPVKIDAIFFNYVNPNWIESTLENHGKLFSGVCVYDPVAVAAIVPAPRHKGSIDAIDRTIAELKSDHPNFCDWPRKSACQMIREALGQREISGNGLSDKNLSKRILKQCPRRGISN